MINEELTCFPIWFAKMRKVMQKRHTELLRPYGLSSIHAMYLVALLNCEEGMTLRELSDFLSVDKANTSRAIATLEELGYIDKPLSSLSKLKYKIILTEQGRQMANIVKEDILSAHSIVFASLTSHEIHVMHEIMRKIQEAMNDI